MKRLRRVYLEISNICNLQCTFCPEVERPKKVMSLPDFSRALAQAAPLADEVCLHLMGEPLSHPDFAAILDECGRQGVPVQLTTNGTLLAQHPWERLLHPCLRQVNFSLHSFKDNFPAKDWRPYLHDILAYTREALRARPDLYINFRLWNLSSTTGPRAENQDFIDEICGFFGMPINERLDVAHRRSKNIVGRAYFHFDTRFEWPALTATFYGEEGFCQALHQHVGVHADGTVVACCLDKEAGNDLGNLFETPLEEILDGEVATKLARGFREGLLHSPLCQRCDFARRFKKPPLPEAKAGRPYAK